MKKLLFLFFLFFSFSEMSISQDCFPEGIKFRKQLQIDEFIINFPDCYKITGDVIISGEDITDLNGLINLQSIGGNLIVSGNYSLPNLIGLGNLDSIGGFLQVSENFSLANLTGLGNLIFLNGNLEAINNYSLNKLSGLNSLSAIGGSFLISENPELTDLIGLEGLDSIAGKLEIWDNEALKKLTGLDNIEFIGDDFSIYSNNKLTGFYSLDTLKTIVGSLKIYDNYSLSKLHGFQILSSVGSNLMIQDCRSLSNISDFAALISLGGNLVIEDNYTLSSLSGLDNIDAGSITDLTIRNNRALSNCEVQSICEYLASPNGKVNIYNNAYGCKTPWEIADSCGVELSCLPYGDYYFTRQTDIDSFQSVFPECNDLKGNVIIDGIENLNGLLQVTSVEGSVSITTFWMTNLSGLDSLKFIGGNLS
ncbi:MAG TPA: hypothetical protein VIN10_07920, partial [Bacteroidales bacterium]